MNKYISILIVSIGILFCSKNAKAGCDPCIQAAAESANTLMTTAINQTTTAVQANITATNALNTALQASNAALQTTIQFNTQTLLSGLDASTNRIELAIQQNSKTTERMTDHLVTSLVSALKEVRVAEEIDKNNKTFGDEISQPLSGDIGANRAPLLKQGFVQSKQMWRQMSDNMHEWNSNTDDVDQGGSGIKLAKLLTEEEDVWDPVPLVSSTQVTNEESLNLQKLITMMVNPVPLPKATDDQLATNPKAAEYELQRRLLNSKLELAHSVLAKSVSDKIPTIPISTDDWMQGYVIAEPDADGKVSVESMLESETIGRLASEGWYQDIKTKSPAGILREQVYMQAIKNKMINDLVEQEEQKIMLLSLLAINDIQSNRPKPPKRD